jgi:hypothetical protein
MATFAFDDIEIKAELFETDGRYDVEAASPGDDFSVLRSSKVVASRSSRTHRSRNMRAQTPTQGAERVSRLAVGAETLHS